MSGGVDSSVAAALLAEAGHEVIGVSMQLYDQRDGKAEFGNCCTLDDLQDARRVASDIGIPHYIMNFERQFEETVVLNFVREYTVGRTPLPCTHCNSDLKFSTLLDRTLGLGAERVATGHYARVEQRADGRYMLKRGADPAKDQSYFLFSLNQAQLSHATFPVGGLNKIQVRDEAQRLGLRVAGKPDSQEICFIPDGNYAKFISSKNPSVMRKGNIVDQTGSCIGHHDGVHHFTIGQRKGLGISAPTPLYVLKLSPQTNTVVVGPRTQLEQTELTAIKTNWIACSAPTEWMKARAQIRHRHTAAPGRVRELENGQAEFHFDEPQLAITPGQAVVFYDNDTVIGGGWIDVRS